MGLVIVVAPLSRTLKVRMYIAPPRWARMRRRRRHDGRLPRLASRREFPATFRQTYSFL